MTDKSKNAKDMKGLLASLIYLRAEVRRAELQKTEEALAQAFDMFFVDLEKKGALNEELGLFKAFFEKAMMLQTEDLLGFTMLADLFENADDIPGWSQSN